MGLPPLRRRSSRLTENEQRSTTSTSPTTAQPILTKPAKINKSKPASKLKKSDRATLPLFIADHLKKREIYAFIAGHVECERSVLCANMMFRFTRPICVAHPHTIEEAQEIVKAAKLRDMTIKMKGGGHSYSGAWTACGKNGEMLLDLIKMNQVSVNMVDAVWGAGSKPGSVMTMDGGAM